MKTSRKTFFKITQVLCLSVVFVGLFAGLANAATSTTTDAENIKSFFEITHDMIRLLSIGIGAALVGSTIFAGIQYTTAGGDSGKVQKAKGRLASNVVVLVLYIFSATILNWILPG